MTNLDSELKGRDITLPTKVHIVKGMFLPVVIYGCESGTIKKAECQETSRINHFIPVEPAGMLSNCGAAEDS